MNPWKSTSEVRATPKGTHEFTSSLSAIKNPYLLCTNIPVYVDSEGHRFTPALWRKDLSMHLRYLNDFTLACPIIYATPPAGQAKLDEDPIFRSMKVVALPVNNNLVEEFVHLPQTISTLWRAIRATDVVHAVLLGVIPYGWVTTLIAKFCFRNRFLVVIIESAPWRLKGRGRQSLAVRIHSSISEHLNRFCVNASDLALFTQEEYRSSLLTNTNKRGYVIHASWIDEENIISNTQAEQSWQLKTRIPKNSLRVLFVGSLVREKGVYTLLEALKLLEGTDLVLNCDILGSGELFQECKKRTAEFHSSPIVRMLGTIPYDAGFFKLVQQYHAVVVPHLSDEQDRIIYDAFSQAVPVLGSNTPGVRSCVQNNFNGRLFEPNSPQALAGVLAWSVRNVGQLRIMGMAGLRSARAETHSKMHEKRWRLLVKYLGARDQHRVSMLPSNQEMGN
jgi:glycosyltransferase involved in cell wall biosynthesis